MRKFIKIQSIILIMTIMVSCMTFIGTAYAENPYGYDLFAILASAEMNDEIKNIIFGGLIDGYGEDGTYSIKSELEDASARLNYANYVKTLLQLDCEAEDISYAVVDFFTFSNGNPVAADIILKYLVSGYASVDIGMMLNDLPFIKAYLEGGYYSSAFVVSVLKNLGSIGKTVYGEEFTMMESYGGMLSLGENTPKLINDNFCEAIIGSNCPEFLSILVGDFAANVSASEVDGVVTYFNAEDTYIKVLEYEDGERYETLFDAYGKSFKNPEELVSEVKGEITDKTSEEKIEKLVSSAVEAAATINLEADYVYTFCEISNEVIEYAYLNAVKTAELFEAEGYFYDLSEIELTVNFEKENDDGVFQIMAPAGMFTIADNYGMTKMKITTKTMTVKMPLPEISMIIPDGAVVVMYVLQKLDVAPDSSYMTPSERPQYAFSVAADAEDLENEWESGDVTFTVDLSEENVPSNYFLREFANDKSILEPESWEYDRTKKELTFNVRPLRYYSFVTAEEEEKIKSGERIVKPIENIPVEYPDYSDENTNDDKDNNNGGGGGGWDDSEYNDMINQENENKNEENKDKENTTEEQDKNETEKPKVSIFSDMETDHWAYPSVETLVMYGVVNGIGEGKFGPDNNVTREEFVKMLLGAMSLQVAEGMEEDEYIFSDVENNEWYAPYVRAAKEYGIVNGISDTEFGVGQPISRQDMATMTMRAAIKCGVMLTRVNANEKKTFADAKDIASYATESISVMQTAGIINGFEDDTFRPEAHATRAESAKIMYSLLKIVEGI